MNCAKRLKHIKCPVVMDLIIWKGIRGESLIILGFCPCGIHTLFLFQRLSWQLSFTYITESPTSVSSYNNTLKNVRCLVSYAGYIMGKWKAPE